jgi:hypothetical protein
MAIFILKKRKKKSKDKKFDPWFATSIALLPCCLVALLPHAYLIWFECGQLNCAGYSGHYFAGIGKWSC